ncbi:J domain-containing protein [Chelativorans salis]|uniref:DnaJ family molecular chaperone n=1 Tax=Chelativorans salis TaxID=2978478 RepID=A0ABT2LLS3_9HYPH|nr:DnaJ family molecular chaperone [Chelativorans sp. EGI FJ00035]MCT7374999.1 DnaJ family molecular chaperone [Chelativorans sp. EGI FJ00035]
MSILVRISDLLTRASGSVSTLVEAVRMAFKGDPELRRRVAFSIALIALSAKMAKADGIVTPDEVRAFHEIFSVPREEMRNVARLYDLAKKDVAGFEVYARQMAGLCGSGKPNCAMLEDILDGLFHIAKADGVLHDGEQEFLARVAEIFGINEAHYAQIRARHVTEGEGDPYILLGVGRDAPFQEIRRRYRELVAESHPDRLIARGVPEEFIAIANSRVAALNAAYEQLEKTRRTV